MPRLGIEVNGSYAASRGVPRRGVARSGRRVRDVSALVQAQEEPAGASRPFLLVAALATAFALGGLYYFAH